MALTSPLLVVLLGVGGVATIALTVWGWDVRRGRWALRAGGVALSQLLLLLCAAAWINQAMDFFVTWSQLLGTSGR